MIAFYPDEQNQNDSFPEKKNTRSFYLFFLKTKKKKFFQSKSMSFYRTIVVRLSFIVEISPILPLVGSKIFDGCEIPSPFGGIELSEVDCFFVNGRVRIRVGSIFKLEINLTVRPIRQRVLIKTKVNRGSVWISKVSQIVGTTGLSLVCAKIVENQLNIV